MHNDLKILFWLLIFSLTVLSIYTVVDLAFKALDRVSSESYYKTVQSSYTDRPQDTDPDVQPDKKWRPKREPLPFLGYAHESVVYIISAILVTALIGFLVIYLAHRKEEQ